MTLTARPDVVDFLQTRRSRPAKTLRAPAPDAETLRPMLEAAVRVPDHGKLEPWRLIVLQGDALLRLAALTRRIGAERDLDADKVEKDAASFENSPLAVAVITRVVDSPKVPVIEQHLSAGAVCLSLVNAALASGWGANWLTAWMAYDRDWLTQAFDVAEPDFVAGFIHIGSESVAPPERPRPDLDAITEWVST